MDRKTLIVFAKKLKELRDSVQSQSIDTSAMVQEKVIEEYERASQIVDQTIVTNLLKRKTLYLKQIDNALQKIESGDYGYCEECGDDISEKRLLARLTALLCIACKSEQERREKEMNRFGINDWENSKSDEGSE